MNETVAAQAVALDFEDLFETAPCGYVLADRDGRITRTNRTLLGWLGHADDALVGKRLSDLMPITGKIFYETHFAPTLHMQGRLNEVAIELVRQDGKRIPMLVNAVASHSGDEAQPRLRFAMFLAAERRGYERGLLEARNKAEAAVATQRADAELREQFIAVLGHDLRNPLASISSGIHMLDKESFTARGKKVVALMAGSVVRASGLIDNVLDFARGRLGGGIALTRNTNEPLEPVLRQVVAELQSVTPGREITAHYTLDELVDCDHIRVGQLLSNLLGNALTHGAREQSVRIEATTTDDELTIAVSNGGEPIPPDAIERLIQPFFRGHDRVRQGLGLGLHIASEIARAHDGTLVARSDTIATTFIFTMPLLRRNHCSD
ncbi:PAS domain-containing sensor histidine kinase [Sphingomonas sp. Leaf24]|uniref:PAS domain-containing sensor histidine kinase n=1 Tax=unclassified Sphingomonas TaxID=196159 RepID=UPI0006F2D3C1|nr:MULTISPECIES: PAS domain-containing sensor histidine kinase [unclassified Sphingomonas]KQM12891.1 PAS domain-containing sensor histidine kinase [Sphingomonas sp. Leaf5]KQM94529.1 PAS domain-containing sensor histidine kinase [Sphingomonas sp. Leaf24]